VTNVELAQKLRDLRDFLIIAGYEESHAFRYTHIARTIEGMKEPVEQLRREGRLTEIPQVGKLISFYIKEILDTGVCSKQRDWESQAPFTVVEMCHVPGIGARTAKLLWEAFKIADLAALKRALESGTLDSVLSEKLQNAVREA
jgi:DNA polymerase (family 10)